MGFLVGEQVVLTNTFLVGTTPTDPGTVSLAVTTPAGVTTTYTFAAAQITKTSTGVYTKTLTPDAAGTWVYVWTGTGPAADIAPGFFVVSAVGPSYVTLAEIRALPNLSDTAKFTNAEIAAAIDWFETTFEDATGVAWVPRTVTERLNGAGKTDLLLGHLFPRTITAGSITTGGVVTALTAPELADLIVYDHGQVVRLSLGSWPLGHRNVSITYSHGFSSPPPDVVEAAKVAVRAKLVDDQTGNRVFAVQTEAGIIRSSAPGADRPFGIPFVDEIAKRRSHKGPGTA